MKVFIWTNIETTHVEPTEEPVDKANAEIPDELYERYWAAKEAFVDAANEVARYGGHETY